MKEHILEKTIEENIDHFILTESLFSSFKPKVLKKYTDEVIDNSFNVVIKGIKTILAGGVIGGILNYIISASKVLVSTNKEIQKVQQLITNNLNSFLGAGGELPEILDSNKDKLNFFISSLKESFANDGVKTIMAGVFVGLTLGLIHAVFIKKYNMSPKKAKEKTIKMAKKASLKSDKDVKKIISVTTKEYQKL